jgi:hypothetical protein
MKSELTILLTALTLLALPAIYAKAPFPEFRSPKDQARQPDAPRREKLRDAAAGCSAFRAEENVLAAIREQNTGFSDILSGLRTTSPGEYEMVLRLSGRLLSSDKIERVLRDYSSCRGNAAALPAGTAK